MRVSIDQVVTGMKGPGCAVMCNLINTYTRQRRYTREV